MNIDIYQYDDYRFLLKACYEEKKKEDPEYSFRKFAKDAGFTNPGFLNDVIKERRALSNDAMEKMILVFSFSSTEAEYFRLLVQYNQSKKEEEKNEIYKKILFRRNRSSFTRLNPSLAKYYQDYRYPLIRSAIEVCDFRGDYEKLSLFLDPPIPSSLLKKYVRDLCEWGIVKQDETGRYYVTSKMVEPPETLLHLVRELNREWIMQAYSALRKFPSEKRHISTMILNVSNKNYQEIKDRIEKFREEIFKIAEQDQNPERVMQLSMQFFPKSATRDNK